MPERRKYDELWDRARPRLVSGALVPDTTPRDGDGRWGLSLVVLPDGETGERIAGVASSLASVLTGGHHVYGRADLHLTVTSLEPYRDGIDPALLSHYVAAVESARGMRDFDVRLSGLGGSEAGIFVQGFDDDLGPLRRRMRVAAAEAHDGVPPAPAFLRDTAHLSVAVFRRRSEEPRAAAFVDARRATSLGSLDGGRLALVRYVPSDDAMRLEVLHAF